MVLNKANLNHLQLMPIGKMVVKEDGALIYLKTDYIQALKHLELFSHALILCRSDETCEFPYTYDLNQNNDKKSIDVFGKENSIASITARVHSIDNKKGILELDHVCIKKDVWIYDIKPYFPCEDRIEKFEVPNFIRQWPFWRQDKLENMKKIDVDNKVFLEIDGNDNYLIEQIGNIKKEEGEYLLELEKINKSSIEMFVHFSHIKIFWWFDRFDKKQYRKITQCNPPYENAPRTGVFASRSPVRPNPIAISTAKVLDVKINKMQIKVSGFDAFDNTPIINIVPYIPFYDRVREFHVPNWLSHWPEWWQEKTIEHELPEIVEDEVNRIEKYMLNCDYNTVLFEDIFTDENHIEDDGSKEIIIKGARQNNLKNISLSIPKNKLTVITGVSGSGKSSLAFDTIYAESQRRFLDSMSTSGRSVFEQMEKPDVDLITGLSPAIAIEQKSIGKNRRSTLGTVTGLYDYLKLLFSKIGIRHCPECGRAIHPSHPEEIARRLSQLLPGSELRIQAHNSEEAIKNLIVPKKQEEKHEFVKKLKHYISLGFEKGNGAIVVTLNENQEFFFSSKNMCYHCNKIFFDLTTSTFSFNNPESMCSMCKGLGVRFEVDTDLIVSNPQLSILDEASLWWGNLRKHREKPNANWMKGEILALAEELKVDLELPWNQLPETFKQQALFGSDGKEVAFVYENSNGRRGEIIRPVEGAVHTITRLFKENSGDTANRIAKRFMRERECTGCHGERLNTEGRLVTIGDKRFPETAAMTIEELKDWIENLPKQLSKEEFQISAQILKGIYNLLDNLIKVGVQYLTLDRSVPTLSNGEGQRLRLANQLDSGLTNLLYILDEPSMGLHAIDYQYLINTMKQLRDKGNTIIVVEHNRDIMLEADRIIDIGPNAGVNGGKVTAEGTPRQILTYPHSETGQYLKGAKKVKHKSITNSHNESIQLIGARENNLKNINVEFPLGMITTITGVSGSGKSSLVSKTLYPAIARLLGNTDVALGDYDKIEGVENIEQVINVTQQPIGRTPRSNPATYTGVFEDIRKLFAKTKEAKDRGYKQNRFSFNSKEGQCEACKGEGRKCVQMHFMPDVWVECLSCNGKRFNVETLEIKYNEKTIADVLDMNIEEALLFFSHEKKIKKVLKTLYDVGLGYIKLGQSALTLSGGEAQRIKLAKELSKANSGKTLYILDEPTTGLHFADVQNLLKILSRIIEAGHTVLIIEHNIDVIKNSNWIIDIGPEGGKGGGYIVAKGTPEEVANTKDSYTGQILKASFSL